MQSTLESLKNELEACDFWDCCFLNSSHHDLIETVAFVNRQKHRKELIRVIAAEEERGANSGARTD
jgi:hypothetical protein